MDGIDAWVRGRGGWHPHETSHIAMGVGVRRHARGGNALWRHEAGPRWAPRPRIGPQWVLQLRREEMSTCELAGPEGASLPRGCLCGGPRNIPKTLLVLVEPLLPLAKAAAS